MRATIRDIAAKSGFSTTTVSLVLNEKKHRIPQETVDAILEAAQELNYRSNKVAVSLITKKTKTIGVVVPDITNPFFAQFVKAADLEFQRNGYNIILCNTNDKPEKDIEYIETLTDRGVDAMIYILSGRMTEDHSKQICKAIKMTQKPFVITEKLNLSANYSIVTIDNIEGSRLAAEHLVELGHTKIGCITALMSRCSSRERFEGFERALNERGVFLDPSNVIEGDFRIESGRECACKLMEKDITAIYAFNDLMALGAIEIIMLSGKSVPDDISVIGFDDISFSSISSVPLTTIRQPVDSMGCQAAKILIENLQPNNEDDSHTISIFQPQIIVRKSTKSLEI